MTTQGRDTYYKKNKEINKHASLEIKDMLGHVNTDLTQNPNNMSIHKIHEDPITPQTNKLPLSLLPLSISPFGNKAPKRKAI